MWQLLSLSPPLLITWESNRIVPQCLEYSSNFLWQSGSHYGISASKTIWKEKLCKGGWKGKQWNEKGGMATVRGNMLSGFTFALNRSEGCNAFFVESHRIEESWNTFVCPCCVLAAEYHHSYLPYLLPCKISETGLLSWWNHMLIFGFFTLASITFPLYCLFMPNKEKAITWIFEYKLDVRPV